jgi:thiosulfate/3-mercaptopyruvate sulfurtransferase
MKPLLLSLALGLLSTGGAARADDVFLSAEAAKGLVGKAGVRFVCADSAKDFEAGHLPGAALAYAHELHLLDDVKACDGLPMCEPRAARLIGETLGIDGSTEVVVYDVGHGVNASGTWFFFKLYGLKSVRILDGGLASWKAAGGAVETGAPSRPASKVFVPRVQREMIATRDEVKRATSDPDHYLILDARHTLDEYTGKTLQSALSAPGKEVTVQRGGAIPGAVFSPFTRYAGNKNGEPGKPTLKDAAELGKQLEKLKKNGYDPAKTVISYCQVGLGRGSFQVLALRAAGHQKVKLYVGSWDEWGNDPALPLASQP